MSFDSGGSVDLGSAHGSIIVSMDDAQRKINGQVGQMERGILRSFGQIGDKVQKMGLGLTKVLSPITGFVVGGISSFAKFDDVLTEIEARTGATAEQMESVRQTALQMGQDTAFSATQASDGMLQLLSSGFDLTQTFAALPAVLDLAAAGMLDMGFAGDAVTDVLAQFNLTAEESEMVADALAQASGSSSATITDLIQGFANVGPIAANFGLSVNETAAALAVFSENGIKGAEAGTQLKSMLTNMTSTVPKVKEMWNKLGVSMFETDGTVRNLDDVIDDLNVAMADMTDEERLETIRTLGGAYGQMGLSALLASDGIDEMQDSMDNAADASDLGEARMKSFRGVVNLLKSSLETIAINVIGPLVENYLQPLIAHVTELLNKFNEWVQANPELISTLSVILGFLAILGPVVFAFGSLIGFVASAIGLMLSPLVLVGAAIAGFVFVFKDALKPLEGIIDILAGFFDRLKMAFEAGGISRAIEFFFARIGNVLGQIWDVITSVDWGGIVTTILSAIGSAIVGIGTWLWDNLFKPMIDDAINWFTSGQAATDLGNLALALMSGLLDAIAVINAGATWLWDNLFKPMVDDAIEWFLSGQAATDLNKLTLALMVGLLNAMVLANEGTTWLWDNLFKPMVDDAIEWFLSGQAATDLGNLALALMSGLLTAMALSNEGVTWLWDNLFKPMINDVIEWFTSGQAATDLGNLALALMVGLLNAMALANEGVTWLWDNMFQPMINAVIEFFVSGQAAELLGKLMGAFLTMLKTAFNLTPMGWLWNNVFKPMLDDILKWFTSGQAADDLSAVAEALLDKLAEGLGDVAAWALDTIVNPMVEALAPLAELVQPAIDALKSAWDTAFSAIGGAADAVWQKLLGGIEGVVNGAIDIINGLIDTYNATIGQIAGGIGNLGHVSLGGGGGSGRLGSGVLPHDIDPSQIPGGADGIVWTGNGPINEAAGVFHRRESVVPHGGMSVTPSPDGLQLNGMRELFSSLMGRGSAGSGPVDEAAGVGDGAGGATAINFNGDIQLVLSEEILRDPEMVDRAEQYGRSFMDGVLTNSDIMERVRGQS